MRNRIFTIGMLSIMMFYGISKNSDALKEKLGISTKYELPLQALQDEVLENEFTFSINSLPVSSNTICIKVEGILYCKES